MSALPGHLSFTMLSIVSFTFNPFGENTYVAFDADTREAVVIDPGMSTPAENAEFDAFIESEKLALKAVINTHCHIDHVLGNWYVSTRYKVPIRIPVGELPVLKAVKAYAPNYGFHQYQEAEPTAFINAPDILEVGGSSFEVMSVPGHSPDHIALYCRAQSFLLGGDVLFHESIGRTDLPGGNFETLANSIKSKLYKLEPTTVVYPGHGPTTTIGHEMKFNPFCNAT